MKQILIVALGCRPGKPGIGFLRILCKQSRWNIENKTSQVILARDGNKTKVTMYNDFKEM